MLGIDQSNRLFYEGSPSLYGHGVWPSPFVSMATIVMEEADYQWIPFGDQLTNAPAIFREDTFDPVTRVRRGRLYEKRDGDQRPYWHVQTHPALTVEVGRAVDNGLWLKQLDTFQPKRIDRAIVGRNSSVVIVLGTHDAHTLWRVIGVERLSTGDDLITLRARTSLGTLPELETKLIPSHGVVDLTAQFENVADAAFRHGPESVIDRCRDAATSAIGLWLDASEPDKGWRREDLAGLVKKIRAAGKEGYAVLGDSANVIARLHARAKPNVQQQHGGRRPVEDDAESALASLGLIIRELQWAKI